MRLNAHNYIVVFSRVAKYPTFPELIYVNVIHLSYTNNTNNSNSFIYIMPFIVTVSAVLSIDTIKGFLS